MKHRRRDVMSKMQRERHERDMQDLRHVMSTLAGRRLVWRILGKCRIFQGSYTGEVNSTIFHEGTRKVGLELLAEIHQHCPEAYLLAQKEAMLQDKADHTTQSEPENTA